MDKLRKIPAKVRKWGRGPNPLILKRYPCRRPEPHRPGTTDYRVEEAAFARVKWELIAEHPGKFVVFVGGEMIGPFDQFSIAVRTAYQKCGHRPIYTKELIADDSVRCAAWRRRAMPVVHLFSDHLGRPVIEVAIFIGTTRRVTQPEEATFPPRTVQALIDTRVRAAPTLILRS